MNTNSHAKLFDLMSIVRFLIGFIFIPHAYSKYAGWEGTVAFFAKAGFPHPEFFVILSGTIELVVGISLMTNILTKYTSLAGAGLMAVATYAVLTTNNPASYWFWNKGGVEYNVLWMLFCLVIFVDAWRKNPGLLGMLARPASRAGTQLS